MFKHINAFASFSVDDIAKAKAFYGETLGLNVTENSMGILELHFDNGSMVIIYPKPNHKPAAFTVLNFPVDDIDKAVEDLKSKGVTMENYDDMFPGMKADAKGIYRSPGADKGPDIAWFLDPAGNGLAVMKR